MPQIFQNTAFLRGWVPQPNITCSGFDHGSEITVILCDIFSSAGGPHDAATSKSVSDVIAQFLVSKCPMLDSTRDTYHSVLDAAAYSRCAADIIMGYVIPASLCVCKGTLRAIRRLPYSFHEVVYTAVEVCLAPTPVMSNIINIFASETRKSDREYYEKELGAVQLYQAFCGKEYIPSHRDAGPSASITLHRIAGGHAPQFHYSSDELMGALLDLICQNRTYMSENDAELLMRSVATIARMPCGLGYRTLIGLNQLGRTPRNGPILDAIWQHLLSPDNPQNKRVGAYDILLACKSSGRLRCFANPEKLTQDQLAADFMLYLRNASRNSAILNDAELQKTAADAIALSYRCDGRQINLAKFIDVLKALRRPLVRKPHCAAPCELPEKPDCAAAQEPQKLDPVARKIASHLMQRQKNLADFKNHENQMNNFVRRGCDAPRSSITKHSLDKKYWNLVLESDRLLGKELADCVLYKAVYKDHTQGFRATLQARYDAAQMRERAWRAKTHARQY